MADLVSEIKNPRSKVFRKAFIKRRSVTTGLFESDWVEITKDVKSWGQISISTTPEKPGTFKFNTLKLSMANDEGKYNPNDDISSLWFNYADMQRTLVKVEAGFVIETQSGGVWSQKETPDNFVWDSDTWDESLEWDSERFSYHGIISGDPVVSDSNTIKLSIKPLAQVFIDYPARLIGGYTSTGLTAEQFLTNVRDHTTGAGNFIFRPFFGDTTTNWDIKTTSQVYGDLNTATAKGIRAESVWSVIERLAQAELTIPYVDFNGIFRFKANQAASQTVYKFFGKGAFNNDYGNNIKTVRKFGPRLSAYYSRIQVRFSELDTETSYYFKESALTISGSNDPWVFGLRTFKFENFFIDSQATAETIGTALFNDLSSLKKEITWQSSFVPPVKILQRIEMSYDSAEPNPGSHWNENDWNTELVWDDSAGDAIKLLNKEFKVISVKQDLNNFKSEFVAREI